MHFRVLGNLAVVGARGRQGAGGPRQRSLLALFLARPSEVLTGPRLADELWDGAPPTTDAALRVQLARLRQLLRDQGLGDVLATRSSGYVLDVAPHDVDAGQFAACAAEGGAHRAAGRHAQAVAALDRALALWEGPAFADAGDLPALRPEVERLEAARLQTEDERAAALVQAGDHARAAAELGRLVREQPLRERFTGLLMVALERGGRQAEALRAYSALRHTLADELGLDPSPVLQRLEQAILRQETGPAVAELLGEPTRPTTTDRSRAELPPSLDTDDGLPFVGRRHECKAFGAVLDGMLDGGGAHVVVVRGEPGIGKSRLLTEFGRAALARGFDVVHGWSDPEPVLPFQALVEAMRPFSADPRFAALVSMTADGGETSAETQRYVLFEAVADALVEATTTRPLVVVIDDAHWADGPTIALLRFVLRRAASSPLLVVVATRSTQLAPALDELLRDLAAQRIVTTVEVGPLGDRDASELARAAVGDPSSTQVATAVAEAGGNPLFVVELARHLDRAALPGSVPDGLRALLRQRTAGLSEPARRVLSAAAVAGPSFSVPQVQAMSATDEDQLVDALEEASAAHMVTESAVEHEAFAFTHDLVRQTLLDDLSAARRRRLHRDAAAWLADHRPAQLVELAHHRCEAVPVVPPVVAAGTAVEAANQAQAAGAHEHAALLARRATDVLTTTGADAPVLLAEALVVEGEAYVLVGQASAARKAYGDALGLLRGVDETELLARAVTGHYAFGLDLGGDADLRDLLDVAIARLRGTDSSLLVRALSAASYERTYAADWPGALSLADEALTMARRLDEPVAVSAALHRLHHLRLTDPDITARLAICREALAASRDTGDRRGEQQVLGDEMTDLLTLGDLAGFQALLERDVELAEEVRGPMGLWFVAARRAAVAIATGSPDSAAQIDAAGALGAQLQVPISGVAYAAQLFGQRFVLDRLGEMRGLAEGFRGAATAQAVWGHAIALCRLDDGDEAGAREIYAELLARGLPDDPSGFLWPVELVVTAESVHRLGTPEQADRLHEVLAPYAGLYAVLGNAAALIGPFDRALALLDHTAGRPADALARLEACTAHCAANGLTPWVTRTRADLTRLAAS